MSVVETVVSVAIGYGVSLVLTITVLPWFGLPMPMDRALGISAIFTVASLLRAYVLRRVFARWAA